MIAHIILIVCQDFRYAESENLIDIVLYLRFRGKNRGYHSHRHSGSRRSAAG